MSDLKYDYQEGSKFPAAALTTRVITLVTLAVSMGLLRSNSVTYKIGPSPVPFAYKDVATYEYVFFAMIAGFAYTLLQLPFAIFFFLIKKRLINNNAFIGFEFYGDKICLTILATAVGSVFGATVETRKGASLITHFDGGLYDANDYHSKVDDFCMISYISAAFLLAGFLCSMTSSIMSSRALARNYS
uniref:CASP-like protein 4D1 n=1 Tax=Erigeron canadensis TaxID=72917 RepID=UPI001CB96F5C|nr:CASP-like protein 4D1 [Erigeron canadensis]